MVLASPRLLLVTDTVGGLGNQLLRFAHLAAHAAATKATLVHPGLMHAAALPALRGDPLCRFPPSRPGTTAARSSHRAVARVVARALGRAPLIRADDGEVDLGGDEARAALDGRRVAVLSGWGLRDAAALTAHADVVRDALGLDKSYLDAGAAAAARAREHGDLVIGVHVRQGDYREWQHGRYFYDDERYALLMRSAMAAFADRRVAFVVCASESRPRDAFAGLPVHPGPGDPYGDLAALAACDRIFGPPSTFSVCAAFLGRVDYAFVVDPERPITPVSFSPWSAA